MARVLCATSGIEFRADHFPIYLTSREVSHPIFAVDTSTLLSYDEKWIEGTLSPTESYLLYLALFNSTGLVRFEVPAIRTALTQSIIAQNMDKLFDVVDSITRIGIERSRTVLLLPSFNIGPETKDLANSKYWIEVWQQSITDYYDGYKSLSQIEKITRKENALERLIKDKTKDISTYAAKLADWAYDAGKFEQEASYVVLDENDQHILMADYWKRIIVACAKSDKIFYIPDIDLTDLIEHCEDFIDHGTIYAATLMTLLREAAERKRTYFDLGDVDIGANGITFRILDADASIEDANKLALIDSAPAHEPIEREYPNKLAYLKARLKWQMKVTHDTSNALRAESIEHKRRASDVSDKQLGEGDL